jgi:molybdopterin-guanine dinucleotide biosynthesis protein MobB
MILGFYGKHNSGKTALIEKIVPELKARGYTLTVVKHATKAETIDTPGKDTYRYGEAGADVAILSLKAETSIILKKALELDAILELLTKAVQPDIILVEGYKKSGIPKIAVGDIDLEENTVLRYEPENDDIDEILNYIDKKLAEAKSEARNPNF